MKKFTYAKLAVAVFATTGAAFGGEFGKVDLGANLECFSCAAATNVQAFSQLTTLNAFSQLTSLNVVGESVSAFSQLTSLDVDSDAGSVDAFSQLTSLGIDEDSCLTNIEFGSSLIAQVESEACSVNAFSQLTELNIGQ